MRFTLLIYCNSSRVSGRSRPISIVLSSYLYFCCYKTRKSPQGSQKWISSRCVSVVLQRHLYSKKIMVPLFRESSVPGYSGPEREPDPARTRTTGSVQGSFTLSGFGRNSARTGLNRTLPSLPEVQTYLLSFRLSRTT